MVGRCGDPATCGLSPLCSAQRAFERRCTVEKSCKKSFTVIMIRTSYTVYTVLGHEVLDTL